jgi:hypothetical protein
MSIANVQIERLITHEVLRENDYLPERPPFFSESLISLEENGKQLVAKRMVDTLSSGSHCVDVTIDDSTAGSPFSYISSMLDATNEHFIENSKYLSRELIRAQTAGSIKAGVAIFVQGTCLYDNQNSRFIAIIKADADQGLHKRIANDIILLELINDMLLGQSQRLFKIGFFIEESHFNSSDNVSHSSDDFSVKIFDHMMQISGDRPASTYFYSTFLKCKLAENSARQTKLFFEKALNTINSFPIDKSKKVNLRGDLISRLRDNRATIEPRSFAQEVIPQEFQDIFVNACRDAGLEHAIVKDISLVKSKLRKQSVKFSSNVTIYAPPDTFRDCVKIETANSDDWTVVKIRGVVE